MKKFLYLLLTISLTVTLTACGSLDGTYTVDSQSKNSSNVKKITIDEENVTIISKGLFGGENRIEGIIDKKEKQININDSYTKESIPYKETSDGISINYNNKNINLKKE